MTSPYAADPCAPACEPLGTSQADAKAWLRENDCGSADCRICRAMRLVAFAAGLGIPLDLARERDEAALNGSMDRGEGMP